MLQDQVDGGAIERWTYDQTDYLDLESDPIVCIFVQHESTSVTEGLIGASQQHGKQVCPCLIPDSEIKLWNNTGQKDRHEGRIAPERWSITISRVFHRTLQRDAMTRL